MDDDRVNEFTELLIACYGDNAEKRARQRIKRCTLNGQWKWERLWRDVAEEIVRRQQAKPR